MPGAKKVPLARKMGNPRAVLIEVRDLDEVKISKDYMEEAIPSLVPQRGDVEVMETENRTAMIRHPPVRRKVWVPNRSTDKTPEVKTATNKVKQNKPNETGRKAALKILESFEEKKKPVRRSRKLERKKNTHKLAGQKSLF